MTRSNYSMLAAAISLALGSTASHGLSLPATQALVNAAPGPGAANAPNVLVVAGASAMRDSFQTLLTQDICQPGSLDGYRAAPTGGRDFRAYSCRTFSTGPNTTTLGNDLKVGVDIVIFYRSEGGSSWGPYSIAQRSAPTAANTGTNFPGIAALDLTGTSTCTTAITVIGGVNFHDCATAVYSLGTDTAVSGLRLLQTELGTADVEPKLFTDTNNPVSIPTSRFVATAPVVAQLKALTPVRAFGQVFNIIGYNNPTGNASAVSDNVNNLTSAEVAGILSGSISDWCQIADVATTHPDCIAGTPEHPITVNRREPGSGTQVGAAAHFLNVNCADSWSFVTNALNGAIEAGSTSTLEGNVGGTVDAIGINVYKNPAPANTKFYTIDGIAPDRLTAAFGNTGNPETSIAKYTYAFEATLTRSPTILVGTIKTALATAIVNFSQRLAGVPNNVSVFAIPGIGGNIPGVLSGAKPVSTTSTNGSACRPTR